MKPFPRVALSLVSLILFRAMLRCYLYANNRSATEYRSDPAFSEVLLLIDVNALLLGLVVVWLLWKRFPRWVARVWTVLIGVPLSITGAVLLDEFLRESAR